MDGALAALLARRAALYGKDREEHYNLISALHKSLRGSDPDAALYWFARMLNGGEDPRYIARRLVRFAAEDIGMADPNALTQALTGGKRTNVSVHLRANWQSLRWWCISAPRPNRMPYIQLTAARGRRQGHWFADASGTYSERANAADERFGLRCRIPIRSRSRRSILRSELLS